MIAIARGATRTFMNSMKLVVPLLVLFLVTYTFAQSGAPFLTLRGLARFSAGPNGATPNGGSGSPAQSASGRFVVFSSTSSNLIPSDLNSVRDIFLRDQVKNTTTRISVSTAGVEASDFSDQPAISPVAPNGFLAVAFSSAASNLSGFSDTLGFKDIFVRLPKSGVTFPITFSTGGVFADGDSDNASVTVLSEPNRVIVAFESDATNLVAGDFAGWKDIFLTVLTEADADAPTPRQFVRISKGASGQEANGPSFDPRVTGDGRFVIFSSRATNLVSGVSVQGIQIYQYEIATGIVSLVSANFAGQPADRDSFFPAVNYDGSVVLFNSAATNLVPGQSTAAKIRLVAVQRDRSKATIVNTLSTNQDPNGELVGNSQVSPDGRFVAFSDGSSDLVSGDTNGIPDLFVRDLESGLLGRVSVTASGVESDTTSDLPVLAGDTFTSLTATISFRSSSSVLTPDASGSPEIFGRSIRFSPLAVSQNSVLRVPPDLTAKKAQIKIKAIKFAGFVDTGIASRAVAPRATQPKTVIQYDYRVRRDGARRDARQKSAKQNTVTFRNLPPGTYTATYRTVVTQGKNVVVRTGFSPGQRFRVKK